MAPRTTVFVAGVTNMERTMANLKATPLWSLWQSEQIVEMRNNVWSEMKPDIEEALGELDLEMDDLTLPTGGAGAAVFWVRDEELGQPMPGVLLYADWGEQADRTGRVIDAMIKKGEEEEDLQYEQIDVVGRTGYRFDVPQPEPEAADEFNGGFGGPMADPAAVLDRIRSVYHVRDDSRFFLCTDLATLTTALEVVDGESHPSVADRDDYQAIMSQVGTGDKYAALLFRDALNLMGGPSAMGPAMMFMPMVTQFVGDIHGIGMTARFQRVDGHGRTDTLRVHAQRPKRPDRADGLPGAATKRAFVHRSGTPHVLVDELRVHRSARARAGRDADAADAPDAATGWTVAR